MDASLLHFRDADRTDIIQAIETRGAHISLADRWIIMSEDGYFYLEFYSPEDFEAEYEENEKERLTAILGGRPSCSLIISTRWTYKIARFALGLVVALLSRHFGVMDDDCGRYWQYEELREQLMDVQATIYSIRGNGKG